MYVVVGYVVVVGMVVVVVVVVDVGTLVLVVVVVVVVGAKHDVSATERPLVFGGCEGRPGHDT